MSKALSSVWQFCCPVDFHYKSVSRISLQMLFVYGVLLCICSTAQATPINLQSLDESPAVSSETIIAEERGLFRRMVSCMSEGCCDCDERSTRRKRDVEQTFFDQDIINERTAKKWSPARTFYRSTVLVVSETAPRPWRIWKKDGTVLFGVKSKRFPGYFHYLTKFADSDKLRLTKALPEQKIDNKRSPPPPIYFKIAWVEHERGYLILHKQTDGFVGEVTNPAGHKELALSQSVGVRWRIEERMKAM